MKVQSHEQLRANHESAPYRAEEAMGFCAPPMIRYPSDTDLRRYIVELDDHEPDFIYRSKRWSANLTLPVPSQRDQVTECE